MSNTALTDWLSSTERAQAQSILNLATLGECLLASCKAVTMGDPTAAQAIANHALGSLDHTDDATDDAIRVVLSANIRLAEQVQAAKRADDRIDGLLDDKTRLHRLLDAAETEQHRLRNDRDALQAAHDAL